MTSLTSTLDPSLRDLAEAISDFRNASFQSCESVLSRLLHIVDEEPLAGFLGAVLPVVDFDSWYAKAKETIRSMVGSGVLTWPAERPARVAMQIALCRAIAGERVRGSARRKVHRRRRLSGLASQRLQPKLLSNAQKPSEPGLSRKPDLLGSSGVTTSLQSRWDEEPSSRRK